MPYMLTTDKNSALRRRELFAGERVPGAALLERGRESRGFCGFGVALTGSSCYNLSLMDAAERRALIEDIYKDKGLSVARLTIGSGDYSAELYSYDDTPFDTSLSHFSVARDEKYIIPMIKEILSVRPDLYIFASPWSPPGWMKTGGAMCGGYMRDEFVDCYADYIVKYIEAYAAHGIKISAVTPQNEPETQHAYDMPCCIWHPETEAAFILALRKKLDARGIDTKIWIYDHNFAGVDRVIWSLDNVNGLADACGGAAFHYYGGAVEQTLALAEKYPRIPLHFTEGGPRLYDGYGTDHCKWALMAVRSLACGYKSFTGWNLLLDENGGPNIGPFSCGGLVTRNGESGELSYSGQYRAFSHFAPYITPGGAIRAVKEKAYDNMSKYPSKTPAVEGVYAENGRDRAYILVNPAGEKRQVQLEADGRLVYAELLPDSVSTVIL